MITMIEVIEQNRHARLEHKWLREDLKQANIYGLTVAIIATIFVIVVGIIRAKVLGF